MSMSIMCLNLNTVTIEFVSGHKFPSQAKRKSRHITMWPKALDGDEEANEKEEEEPTVFLMPYQCIL
ncbi:hypothetical protein ACLKA6_005207 [Drosophila palustris]